LQSDCVNNSCPALLPRAAIPLRVCCCKHVVSCNCCTLQLSSSASLFGLSMPLASFMSAFKLLACTDSAAECSQAPRSHYSICCRL
jgi:hypothetical protein